MYSIYVTNKTRKNVYIRLQRQAISSSNENFHRELDKLTAGDDDRDGDVYDTKSCVNSYLVRWGFFIIPAQETMGFAVEVASDEARMYASLYARGKLWIMDHEVNCVRYGCLFVLRKNDATSTYPPGFPTAFKQPAKWLFYLIQANPKPAWIPTEAIQGKLNENAIKAGFDTVEGDLYFGRSSCCNGTQPCKVTIKAAESVLYSWYTIVHGEKQERGELLKDTGHKFVRASRGDPVPPNAVICGVTDPEGTLYLGRVGGNIPCAVSSESDRIKYFCYYAGEVKQVESGEIIVLTK